MTVHTSCEQRIHTLLSDRSDHEVDEVYDKQDLSISKTTFIKVQNVIYIVYYTKSLMRIKLKSGAIMPQECNVYRQTPPWGANEVFALS